MNENDLSKEIIGLAIKVHRVLGPGLLESVYEKALLYELKKNNISYENQVKIDVQYESIKIKAGFIADIIVENKVIIELKSVERIIDIHKKQLLTYLKLSGLKLGLLINFNEKLLKNGLTRIVNKL